MIKSKAELIKTIELYLIEQSGDGSDLSLKSALVNYLSSNKELHAKEILEIIYNKIFSKHFELLCLYRFDLSTIGQLSVAELLNKREMFSNDGLAKEIILLCASLAFDIVHEIEEDLFEELVLTEDNFKLLSSMTNYLANQLHHESALVALLVEKTKHDKSHDDVQKIERILKEEILKNVEGSYVIFERGYFDIDSIIASSLYESSKRRGSIKFSFLQIIKLLILNIPNLFAFSQKMLEFIENPID